MAALQLLIQLIELNFVLEKEQNNKHAFLDTLKVATAIVI